MPSFKRREVTKEPLQVVVRLRPLAGVSAETGYAWSIERRPDGQQWVCHQGKPESKGSFTFDHCFDDRTSNRELFDATAKTLVQAAVGGSNASILAYGQTSSGKTHSILGTPYEPGILSLSVEEIFGFQEDGLRAVGKQASVSYYEIFNEKVTDLLATNPVSTSLPVKESAGHGFFVQGLREAPVYSNEDVLCLVARGEERRRYARTRWNDYSSRSHVIFTLSFAARGAIEVSQARSKLNIVDLAGCENHKHEASEDGRHINRSLFFLGEVISKLCKDGHRLSWSPTRRSPSLLRKEVASPSPSPRELSRSGASWSAGLRTAENSRPRSPSRTRERSDFIPYRHSKLTRVLCSSLGGDARTLLLVTVHPAASFAEQSLTSLRFATKARSVDNYIPGAGSAGSAGSETSLATSDAQRTIEVLQDKLRRLEERQERGVAPGVADPYRRKDRRGPDADLLQKELEHMRVELREKERELANQARLLSERDRQLGQLREQLDMVWGPWGRQVAPLGAWRSPLAAVACVSRVARRVTLCHHELLAQLAEPKAKAECCRSEADQGSSACLQVSTQSSSTVATEEDHSIKGGRLMGSAVKSLLKHRDGRWWMGKALGVKFVLGETRVDACYGRISIDGLTIENPEGFSSEYLLKASKLMIDLDMQKLITSWGKTLEVEKVVLEDVDVIYEKSWSTSNDARLGRVDTVNQKLTHSRVGSRTPKHQPEKVVVHKVLLSNIGAKACTTLGSMGPRLAVGDIKYEDFNAEMGAQTVVDGIALVLETLLKSIVASLLGKDESDESCKSAWGALAHGKTRARLAVSQLCQQISDLGDCSSCRSCQRGEEVILDERDGHLAAKRHEGHRRHGPDAGGGLPPKADHWISGSFPEGLPFAGSEDFIESSQTWPLTSPMTRVSSASRAEDIPCLRSSSSFVMRQQQTPSEERGTAICETQEELVEKLVKMAAMQINTSKAQFAASSERETTDQPKEEAAANRKAEERKTLGPRRGCPPGPPAKAAGEGVPKNDLADSR
eukprot:s820_g6.t1